MKKTPWFDGNVKPVHVGVYERKFTLNGGAAYWHWDGKRWLFGGDSRPLPKYTTFPSFDQSLPWRGLTKEQA